MSVENAVSRGQKKLFDFPEENMIYYPALSEQRKRKSGFRAHSFFMHKERNDEASGTVGNAVLLTIVSGLVITALYLSFSKGILTVFGGTVNEETYRQAKEYFFWITSGIPFYMFGQAMNPIIRSDGSPPFCHGFNAGRRSF